MDLQIRFFKISLDEKLIFRSTIVDVLYDMEYSILVKAFKPVFGVKSSVQFKPVFGVRFSVQFKPVFGVRSSVQFKPVFGV